jgi:hypothetical protein
VASARQLSNLRVASAMAAFAIGLPAVIERLHALMQTCDVCERIHILVESAKASVLRPYSCSLFRKEINPSWARQIRTASPG